MNNEDLQKKAFAALLFNEPGCNVFMAALSLFPEDTGTALFVSQHWPKDTFVLSEICRLGALQPDPEALPTAEDLKRKVWAWLDRPATLDEKIKAAKLYAELCDMMPKKEANPTGGASTAVFLMTDHGDNLTWEQKLLKQQNDLIKQGEREIAGERIGN